MARSGSPPLSQSGEATTAKTYRLTCTDCGFETTVDGDSFDALDVADAHQDEYEAPFADHFVDFAVDR